MSNDANPTIYLFVNKDSDSTSLSRSHGQDASAILSHVQSCRNQKNKQLHMFRVDDGTPESLPKRPGPPTPQSSRRYSVPSRQNSPMSPPSLRTENSSGSSRSVSMSPVSNLGSASPQSPINQKPEVDELVEYFDSLCLTAKHQAEIHSNNQDLYHQIVASEDFRDFSRRTAQGAHGYAMLACTAAKMATDTPIRREGFTIVATKYMQPSLQCLREQLADSRARTMTDRQILREMLLHCVTNWYLRDFTAAQTHLTAMSCFTGCLDDSRSSDRKLMDIINRCGLYITNSQRAQQRSRRNSGIRLQQSADRIISRTI